MNKITLGEVCREAFTGYIQFAAMGTRPTQSMLNQAWDAAAHAVLDEARDMGIPMSGQSDSVHTVEDGFCHPRDPRK